MAGSKRGKLRMQVAVCIKEQVRQHGCRLRAKKLCEHDSANLMLHSYSNVKFIKDENVKLPKRKYKRRVPFPKHLAGHNYCQPPWGERLKKTNVSTPLGEQLKKANVSSLKKKVFQCPFCNSVFKTKYQVKRHERTHKDEMRGYPFCDKAFHNTHVLHLHVFTHFPQKPFICGRCDADYENLTHLQDHLKRKHLDEIYQCPGDECAKTYKMLANLAKHIMLKH